MTVYLLWRETEGVNGAMLKGVYANKAAAKRAADDVIHGVEWIGNDYPEGSCVSNWAHGYRVIITPEKVRGIRAVRGGDTRL